MDRDHPPDQGHEKETAAHYGPDADRAAAIRPAVESLLRRLSLLSGDLTPEVAPAPGPLSPRR